MTHTSDLTSDTSAAPDPDQTSQRALKKRATVATVAAGAIVALGVGGFLSTTAAFTDQETVTGNTVGTATLSIGDTVKTPIQVADLQPGETAPAQDVITFTNDGTVDYTYTVTLDPTSITTDIADPAISDELLSWIPVTITSGATTDTGTLADLPTLTNIPLVEGADATVTVTVGLDGAADNDVQGKTATFDLVVTANQS